MKGGEGSVIPKRVNVNGQTGCLGRGGRGCREMISRRKHPIMKAALTSEIDTPGPWPRHLMTAGGLPPSFFL